VREVEKFRMEKCMFQKGEIESFAKVMNSIPFEAVKKVGIGVSPDEAIEQIDQFRRTAAEEVMSAWNSRSGENVR
jgi:hypothetical protein